MSDSAASEQGQPVPKQGAGPLLLAERRRQGLSLGDISRQLKLSVRQVEALERDDYDRFRGPVFVHGFIRNYAKLLGIDSEALIVAADSVLKPPVDAQTAANPGAVQAQLRGRAPGGLGKIAAGITVVLVVAAIVYLGGREHNEGSPEPPAAVSQPQSPDSTAPAAEVAQPAGIASPSETLPASTTEPAASGTTIRLVFDQESWVEIKDGNSNIIFGQLVPAGSRRSVSGEPPLSVVIGNAEGVRLSYKTKDVDLTPHTRVNVARLTLD